MTKSHTDTDTQGTLILLSGPTSVGKTSIAKALQQLGHTRGKEILHIEADSFMPSIYSEEAWKDPNFRARMVAATVRAAHSYCLQNFDVILDGILPYKDTVAKEAALAEFNTVSKHLYVGVICDVEEIKKRVKLRPDRDMQHAIAQANDLHDGQVYDILLDSTATDAASLAKIIDHKLWPAQA